MPIARPPCRHARLSSPLMPKLPASAPSHMEAGPVISVSGCGAVDLACSAADGSQVGLSEHLGPAWSSLYATATLLTAHAQANALKLSCADQGAHQHQFMLQRRPRKLATVHIEHVHGNHDQYLNQPLMTRSMHGIPILMPILTVAAPILTVTAVWSVHRHAQTRYNRVGDIWCRHMVYGASAMSSATVKSRSLLTTDV